MTTKDTGPGSAESSKKPDPDTDHALMLSSAFWVVRTC